MRLLEQTIVCFAAALGAGRVGVTQDAAPAPRDYVVLAAIAAEDPFDAAAQRLAAGRDGLLLRFDPADLEPLREPLRTAAPRHVAIVLRPEQLEFDLQRRMLQLATELDDDPFVDFAFGYVTGRTAEDALALAERGLQCRPREDEPTYAAVCGGVEKSWRAKQPFVLRGKLLDGLRLFVAGATVHPKTGRDVDFLREHLRRIEGRQAITFVGHGYPREIVGGPTFAELRDLRLDGAVVLSVPCYTGVTSVWYDNDWERAVLRRREVPLDESFCLQLLRTGVVGYTAYLCPRPAGPELDTDLADLLCGSSLGEARRRDYDETVLGCLGFGEERLLLAPVRDGAEVRMTDPVRDLMLEGATGGVVFGDPAAVPFAARPELAPIGVEVAPTEGGIEIGLACPAMAVYTQCADQTAKFGDGMAMKMTARVPLGAALVKDVDVLELRVGGRVLPARTIWAVEEDHGERFLQVKVNWQRELRMPEDVSADLLVQTTDDPALARQRGRR